MLPKENGLHTVSTLWQKKGYFQMTLDTFKEYLKKESPLKTLVVSAFGILVAAIVVILMYKIVVGVIDRPSVANILKMPIPVYGYKVGYRETKNFLGANADTEGFKVISVMVPEVEFTGSLKVVKIPVEIGKNVKKGDIVAVIESYQLNVSREADVKRLKEVKQELKSLDKSLIMKKDLLTKMSDLFEKKYVGLLDLEKIRDDVRSLEEKRLSLQTEATLIEKDLKKINSSLAALTARAPIDGYVTEKAMSENAEVFPKAKIVEVSSISPLKIIPHISHFYLDDVRKGQEVFFRFSESGKEYKGTLSSVYRTVDKKTQTFDAEILFDNNDKILPGTAAFVRFSDINKKILLIPKFSVAGMPDAPTVFIVKDKKASARRVVLGEFYPFGLVEVKEGLNIGDVVIKSSLKYINEGTRVRLLGTEG